MKYAALAALLGAAASALPAHAQDADAARFFKDKTITIAVGSSPGGGLDVFGRLVSRHLGKHVPGNPNVIVSNVPGAGGNVLAQNLNTLAP